MIGRALCRLVFVAVSMTTLCQGSKIVFTATPTTIAPEETRSLTIRCALESGGKSPATRVSNIIISKDDGLLQSDVARIAFGGSAEARSTASGVTVKGSIPDEYGYLQATWSSPGQLQAIGYKCEIVALDTDGTKIRFTSKLQVSSTGQSVDELAKLIAKSSDEIEALKIDFENLKASSSEWQRDIDTLKNAVKDLNTNIAHLSSPHNEQGSVVCKNSDSWGGTMKPRETVKEVRFSTPYATIPQVDISLVQLDVNKDRNARYQIAIRDLTVTGFKVVCGTWWDTLINLMEVRWTSSVA